MARLPLLLVTWPNDPLVGMAEAPARFGWLKVSVRATPSMKYAV